MTRCCVVFECPAMQCVRHRSPALFSPAHNTMPVVHVAAQHCGGGTLWHFVRCWLVHPGPYSLQVLPPPTLLKG